jgi:phosphatidylserine/phosphatidylglycerophosphate/cardiolipin synthase-like enzyme
MIVNLSAIGTDGASADIALQIASIPYLTPEVLLFLSEKLIEAHNRDGAVSVQTTETFTGDRLGHEQLESIFFALMVAGVLTRRERSSRGLGFDRYQLDPVRLQTILHEVGLVRHVLARVDESKKSSQIELAATFPKGFALRKESRLRFRPIASVLHSLITEAEHEVLILNPFFEQAGFERIAPALLAAADRRVSTTIITYRLSSPGTFNRKVLQALAVQANTRGLKDYFKFWEYRYEEGGRVAPGAHAKVIVVDGKSAYIGSANLTEYGMSRYLEIGVVLRGEAVIEVKEVILAILESDHAKQVEIPLGT